ncbi:hypothetical protein GTO91_16810 [Heliobacterium undosum]|uniref:DUF4134 domain-containing protein n=1 Tax=Heliomicrobium undosum TaxID=121734 RepID=A0A845L4Y3_9FIRM|nr:hypothetical protein [Heliomicrobium undosum]MZP31363.1 hypothetical protein [Heliomicrobium undosum]
MKMKKKVLVILALCLVATFLFSGVASAADTTPSTGNVNVSVTGGVEKQSLETAGNKFLTAVMWVMGILTIVCAVAMATIGAKMAALGSNPQKRADMMMGFLMAMGGTAICGGAWFLTSVALGIFQ